MSSVSAKHKYFCSIQQSKIFAFIDHWQLRSNRMATVATRHFGGQMLFQTAVKCQQM
jgi:hypothetical protein